MGIFMYCLTKLFCLHHLYQFTLMKLMYGFFCQINNVLVRYFLDTSRPGVQKQELKDRSVGQTCTRNDMLGNSYVYSACHVLIKERKYY
jgi:hypothetical protein